MTASDVAILAGGRGTRLGGVSKPLLEVGGVAILDRQLAAIAPAVARIGIVAPDSSGLIRDETFAIADPGTGPLAAVVAALEWCATDRLLVVAGDLPFVNAAAIELLERRAGDADLVAPVIAGMTQSLLALYRVASVLALARELAAAGAGPRRLFERAELSVALVSEVDCREQLGGVEFASGINDAEDLERAQQNPGAR